jgi:hypothetical protein
MTPFEMAMRQNDQLKTDLAQVTRERDEARSRFKAPVVCMCGSTRFKQTWIAENARLTGEGNIVLAVGLWGHHERRFPDEQTKKALDELHKRKIDLCDWVWVLDVDGYIGESTRSEIAYAEALGKRIEFLSVKFPEYQEPIDPVELRAVEAERELAALKDILESNSLQLTSSEGSLGSCRHELHRVRADLAAARKRIDEAPVVELRFDKCDGASANFALIKLEDQP